MNDLDTLNTSLATMVPKLSAANQSVIKNATGHAANLTDEARKIQRSVIAQINKLMLVFHASVLLLIMNFVITLSK